MPGKKLEKTIKKTEFPSWIVFVAFRYIHRKGRRSSASSVLPVLGIAVGVLALTVIIAVMNGFQLGFVETILEVSSYHIRIDTFPADRTDVLERMERMDEAASVVPFREVKGILRRDAEGTMRHPGLAVLRALPADVLSKDSGMASKIDVERGSFDIDGQNTILLGAEAAARAGAGVGSRMEFISIADILPVASGDPEGGGEADGGGEDSLFTVAGIFRTGFYEYDTGWAFVNIDAAAKYTDGASFTVGIKLKNRWRLNEALEQVNRIIAESGLNSGPDGAKKNAPRVSTWRDYNKAFFGALRTEKLMMFVLVGLIFIVVALNIFQGQRRIVLEKRDEIGLLRSVGASELDIRCVFTFNGVIIGLTGALSGMIPALLISTHIKQFFTLIETVVNLVLKGLSIISGGWYDGAFSVFSPAVFYIKEIPSRIIPHEVVLIFLFGFLSAATAAWLASKKAASVKPAEVLRYE
ncbi:MAG: ABC transporter permease [Spirochaetaceae bacterium]|jgi:lipoprotein-releasing system permease protein|nr:ABC transporter permease [Spirochaetaceae bacterium]